MLDDFDDTSELDHRGHVPLHFLGSILCAYPEHNLDVARFERIEDFCLRASTRIFPALTINVIFCLALLFHYLVSFLDEGLIEEFLEEVE